MAQVKVGLIGGSGLGNLLAGVPAGTRHHIETPFGPTSDAIIETEIEGVGVLNPSKVPYRANIFALKQLGCTHIIASGAVGSLRQEMKPRDLVVPDQIIDKTAARPATFFEKSAVHVEFGEPFCPLLRRILIESAPAPSGPVSASTSPAAGEKVAAPAFAVHDRGCYVCMEGPAFSTRAESLMHRLWGGDLIGMTVMPEAKLAREAEISYALVALVTDYDCWKPKPAAGGPGPGGSQPQPASAPVAAVDPAALLQEIIANLQTAAGNAMDLIRRALKRIAGDPAAILPGSASEALKLAIWSDKAAIDRNEVDRLKVLWGKYFE
jgi:5'-methylthioadenosine phosphorylase